MLEAEVKLKLDDSLRAALETRLAALEARPGAEVEQIDEYLAHPSRDFRRSDEALRLRRTPHGLRLTYKGPKLDPPRKTREEIEFELATRPETAARLFARLGFRSVACVRKRRREYRLRDHPPTAVAIDEVRGLGWFCEVEVEAQSVAEGRERLAARLRELGLEGLRPVAESYLELLLRARAISSADSPPG